MKNKKKKYLFYSSGLFILLVCLVGVGHMTFSATRLFARTPISMKIVEESIHENEAFHVEITDKRSEEELAAVSELAETAARRDEDSEKDSQENNATIRRIVKLRIPEGITFETDNQIEAAQEELSDKVQPVFTWDSATRQVTISMDAAQTSVEIPLTAEKSGKYTIALTDEEENKVQQETQVSILDSDEKKTESVEATEQKEEQEIDASDLIDAKNENGETQAVSLNDRVFDGETAEVTTFEELRLAVADPEVGTVEVRSNLTRSGTGAATAINSLNRSLLIKGNGYTINFGADNGSLELSSLSEDTAATVRLENATITKTGANPIFNAAGTGLGWTLELEDIIEGTANAARLALIPEGSVLFTGGTNSFVRTNVTNVFLQAKYIEARGGAQVTISRGNAGVLFSAATVEQPKISVKEAATIAITTASGTSIPVDLRGSDAEINVSEESSLRVQTQGTTATATNTTNNAIAMSGSNPTLSITGNSSLGVTTTSAKRGIALIGSTPDVTVRDSSLTVTSATVPAVFLNGQEALLATTAANVNITTTTGRGIELTGERALADFENSEVAVTGQTTARIYISGNEGKFAARDTRGKLTSTTGSGIYLTGGSNEVLIDEGSEWELPSSGTAQNIGIVSTNPKLQVLNNSTLTATSAQGTTVNFLLQGINPEFRVENESNVLLTTSGTSTAATDTTNLGISLTGSNPIVTVLNESELKVNVTANAKRGLHLNGAEPKVTVDNSNLDLQGFTGHMLRLAGSSPALSLNNAQAILRSTTAATVLFQGADAELSATNSEMDLVGGTTGNRLQFANGGSNVALNNSILDTVSTTGIGLSMSGADNNLLITNDSVVTMNSTTGNSIAMTGANANFTIDKGSLVTTKTGAADSIRMIGNAPTLKVLDEGTKLTATSSYTSSIDNTGTVNIGSGTPDTRIENYLVEAGEGAVLDITSNMSSALVMQGNKGVFNLYNQGQIYLSTGLSTTTTGGAASPLRFIRSGVQASAGDNTFIIDNALMEIKKTGGNAPGVRMFGTNNTIHVRNEGEFTIDNPGNGTANNGNAAGGNQGIHYTSGTNNTFIVEDIGSRIDIRAASGPAIDMGDGSGSITASNGGYFEASGRTSTAAGGIFNGGVLAVDFDNPLFMNFRNNRVGGGNIFNNTAASTLEAKNSDLAVWQNGSNLDGDPDLNFPTLDFAFTGANFITLGATNKPDVLNTETFGTTGLTAYSRLSSNNARWAIADELRVPTNADKRIYGHVSIPVGLENSRSAWDDEATVVVEIERTDGSTEDYTAKTVGHSNEEPGISIYDEEPRGGLFEIELVDFLQVGDKVRIKEVSLTSGELTEGFENIISTDTVTVFPIIPPKPAEFSSELIKTTETVLVGHSDNPDVEVTATYNGEAMDTSSVLVDSSGNFELPLTGLTLVEGDSIQVFLRDKEGSAEAAGVINPASTNNDVGNINPASELNFHDATFTEATTLTVVDAEAVLTVEFVNELEQILPGYTLTLDGYQVGDEVDLTKEQAVIEQIANLEDAGYEIVERPANENAVKLDLTEVTVQYKIQGVLTLASAPDTLDFGTLTYNAQTQRVEEPQFDEDLIVADTRAGTTDGWTLSATLSSPLMNEDGKELVNALRYVWQGEERVLNQFDQLIYTNTTGSAGVFNVSDSWGSTSQTDGLKLQLDGQDNIFTGSYTGVITWKVMAGQP